MSNKSATFYLSKVLTVLDWIRAGKSDELRECGKISGRCAEIVSAQTEILNEVRHIISSPETLNAFFAMATKRESVAKSLPNLFSMLERDETNGVISMSETMTTLKQMRDDSVDSAEFGALEKAVMFMEIVNRFLAKKG